MKTKEKSKIQIKYARKQLIIIIILVIFAASLVLTLSRYVIDKQKNFFSRSGEFYFNSDKLSEENPAYALNNWSGQGTYAITINMNSKQNDLITATYDIDYNISCTYSNNVICSLSKTKRNYICKYKYRLFYYNHYTKYSISTGRYGNCQCICCGRQPISKNHKCSFHIGNCT